MMAKDTVTECAASPQKDLEREALSLNEYTWSDDGAKVKVYVPCDALHSRACGARPSAQDEGLVTANFESTAVSLDVATVPRRKFRLCKLNKEIEPLECRVRADLAKGRITITLVKKQSGAWHDLVSKT